MRRQRSERTNSANAYARPRRHGAISTIALLAAGLGLSAVACDRTDTAADNHLDALPRLAAETDMRLGDFEDPDLGFSRVYDVDVDEDGNIYVLEASVPEIRVFSPTGELQRRIGRRGGGPSEFESVPRFGVVGDTIWAIDNAADRITLFDRQGAVRSTGRFESVLVHLPGGSLAHVRPWLMRRDGYFASHLSRISYNQGDPSTEVSPDSVPVPNLRFAADGSVQDTIGWANRPPPRMWRPPSQSQPGFETIEIGGGRAYVPRPPSRLAFWEAHEDGYAAIETPHPATADEGVITIHRVLASGDTAFSTEIRYAPTPYSAADLDSIAVRAARGGAGPMVSAGGSSRDPAEVERVARRLREAMDFPEFRLPVQSTWLAQDESLWLLLQSSDGEPARWLVLDPDGTPRGVLTLAPGTRPAWHRGDTFWATQLGNFDVPWLVRFTIGED